MNIKFKRVIFALLIFIFICFGCCRCSCEDKQQSSQYDQKNSTETSSQSEPENESTTNESSVEYDYKDNISVEVVKNRIYKFEDPTDPSVVCYYFIGRPDRISCLKK